MDLVWSDGGITPREQRETKLCHQQQVNCVINLRLGVGRHISEEPHFVNGEKRGDHMNNSSPNCERVQFHFWGCRDLLKDEEYKKIVRETEPSWLVMSSVKKKQFSFLLLTMNTEGSSTNTKPQRQLSIIPSKVLSQLIAPFSPERTFAFYSGLDDDMSWEFTVLLPLNTFLCDVGAYVCCSSDNSAASQSCFSWIELNRRNVDLTWLVYSVIRSSLTPANVMSKYHRSIGHGSRIHWEHNCVVKCSETTRRWRERRW